MVAGIEFYCDSFVLNFDSENGFSMKFPEPRPQEPNPSASLGSEEDVKKYLSHYGIKSIQSVKFVEPKFPKHHKAKQCHSHLKSFAESLYESDGCTAYPQWELREFCGVDIQYSAA